MKLIRNRKSLTAGILAGIITIAFAANVFAQTAPKVEADAVYTKIVVTVPGSGGGPAQPRTFEDATFVGLVNARYWYHIRRADGKSYYFWFKRNGDSGETDPV